MTNPQLIIRCPLNVRRHEILLSLDAGGQRLALYFTMFERLRHAWVQQFYDADFSRVRVATLACLDELGSWAYQDSLALYKLMKLQIQSGVYRYDAKATHARLAFACIRIIERSD